LTRSSRTVNHFRVIRSTLFVLRCAFLAAFSLAMIAARPAMMLAHGAPAAQHGCGMAMATHHSPHESHRCSSTGSDECCDDCMSACAIGSDLKESVVMLAATYTQVATVIAYPAQIVRPRQPLALRLPPPLGPPLLARS
jgi:hypothetical protein